MNPRHAAALVLVGWYLMLPPFKPINTLPPAFTLDSLEARVLNTEAPLSQWEIYQACDSADECEAAKTATLKLIDQEKLLGKDGALTERGGRVIYMWFQLRHSQCIASDDPRLAK